MASERYFEILLSRSVSCVFGEGYSLVAQQLTLPSGRIDLLLQHCDGAKHVIEVKKDRAKSDAVDQVGRYVEDFKLQGAGIVHGWVVANEIPEQTDLYAAEKDIRTLAIPERDYAAIMTASGVSEEDLLGKRVQAGILIGGGVQSFPKNAVPLEDAITNLSADLRAYVVHQHSVGTFEFQSGKMQIAVIYKGVKIGGINRGHKHNFISSNIILDGADEAVLVNNGFVRVTKTQASSAHVHVYWKNKIDDVEALDNVLAHFSASIDRRLFSK
ncbi:endonuclease NucS domain-containing protein [uncultured Aliiroseovarius sp.]|uniref:endonuclease NucS domain-containing protein n=1 Tax=uncultured Aliiroseovarius sp. TaxID=1658783 RepID=UPI00261A6E42|nr:endonuclease NucS domain-containing protein [uncultured Aliiroseovarius sp.]